VKMRQKINFNLFEIFTMGQNFYFLSKNIFCLEMIFFVVFDQNQLNFC
jgi:hypothetical protein